MIARLARVLVAFDLVEMLRRLTPSWSVSAVQAATAVPAFRYNEWSGCVHLWLDNLCSIQRCSMTATSCLKAFKPRAVCLITATAEAQNVRQLCSQRLASKGRVLGCALVSSTVS